ncbi:general stress protein [Tetzosporium hominis]|nr:general stress protein [Tetzosporium hominis]
MVSKTATYWIETTAESLKQRLIWLQEDYFEQDEIIILARNDRQVEWLKEHTSLQIQTDPSSFLDAAAAFFKGEDTTQDVLLRLGFEKHESDQVVEEIGKGHYFVYADRVHGANIGATDDAKRHIR